MTFPREDLQTQIKPYVLDWTAFRTWDARGTNLPNTAAADDLGLVTGTYGTDDPLLEGVANAAGSSQTQYGGVRFALPAEYVTGGTVTFRAIARVSAVANTAATVDFEASLSDRNAGVGSDLVTTAATTINATSWTTADFTVTPTGLLAGDVLDIRLTTVSNDTGGAATGRAQVGYVAVLLQVKG